jgi:hypothetical protein
MKPEVKKVYPAPKDRPINYTLISNLHGATSTKGCLHGARMMVESSKGGMSDLCIHCGAEVRYLPPLKKQATEDVVKTRRNIARKRAEEINEIARRESA